MQDPFVLTDLENEVYRIQLNRPDKLNALTDEMYGQLVAALAEAESDKRAKVILIGSSSKHFCAGNDLADFLQTPFNLDSQVIEFLRSLARLTKPLVFAVSGAAVGIGTTMLLHGDLVVGSEKARFSVPFIHLGLSPEGGSSRLLAERVGQSVANDWLYTGRTFDGQEAFQRGLISQMVPADESVWDFGVNLAEDIARHSSELLQQTKSLLKSKRVDDIVAIINEEALLFGERLATDEAKSAFRKFLEKSS